MCCNCIFASFLIQIPVLPFTIDLSVQVDKISEQYNFTGKRYRGKSFRGKLENVIHRQFKRNPELIECRCPTNYKTLGGKLNLKE